MPLNMILTVLIWLYNSNLNKQVLIWLPGENLLALLRKLASSPKLADPGLDKHGTMVFFDVVGYFMVHYPQRIGVIINCALVAAVMFKVIRKGLGMSSSAGKFSRMISKCIVPYFYYFPSLQIRHLFFQPKSNGICLFLHQNIFCILSGKGFTLKGKNLPPIGAFLFRVYPFSEAA